MGTFTLVIVILFLIGYLFIALESVTEVNKAAIALLMCVLCWSVYVFSPGAEIGEMLKMHLGDTAETLFFLMGAMTIVEIVDANGGFNFVRDMMKTRDKRKLLWRVAIATFFLSAILDNLTTSIVMVMVLRKLVRDNKERMIYAGLVIIAANAGGAFSPIGDVTTIMLWIKGMITTQGVITEIFLPSLMAMVVPTFILQYQLKGKFDKAQNFEKLQVSAFTETQRKIIFFCGVGGLIFVPIFRAITDLPPYMGILLVLGILWTTTEIFHRQLDENDTMAKRVTDLLTRIDIPTILFFLGILMAVACLEEVGVLTQLGKTLDDVTGGNHYLVTGIIGVLSSIVDNVPLVAGCMGMYPIAPTGDMAVDGIFWQ
ncbi:MAG: sodium:proton antiporter NhaD, partial [Prevotella sp.]|nr:sodium:proton antiporter NhaD [Prevotella sp.]